MATWQRVGPGLLLICALLAPGMAPSQPAASTAADDWQITCVDCPKWFRDLTDRTLRVDDDGHPHLAYGGDHLYYASHDGSGWRYETVDDSAAVGSFASLDLDQHGQPHVGYYDSLNQDLRYAYRDSSGWRWETVDSAGPVGQVPSLAVDSAGQPHFSYFDESHDTVKHAYRDASGWRVQTVGAASTATWRHCNSLALDSAGFPHVAYPDPQSRLQYAYRDAGGWHMELLEGAEIGSCSLALSLDNRPTVAYAAHGQLIIARWTGMSWTYEYHSQPAIGVSLALDPDGYPHITGTHRQGAGSGYTEVLYLYQDARGWHSDSLGGQADLGQTSLDLNGEGSPLFSYQGVSSLRLARRDAEGWHQEEVDTSQDVGRLSSLAIGGDGQARVAYSGQFGSARFAEWTGQGWSIDPFGQYYPDGETRGISLALDASNQPHVAHAFDYRTSDLYRVKKLTYRQREAATWLFEIVEEGELYPEAHDPALALDARGDLHISYVREWYDDFALRHALRVPAGWEGEVVDPEVRTLGSLVLDSAGNPVLGYTVAADVVKIAHQEGAGWHHEIVDMGGTDVSLALDSHDIPHLSYRSSGIGGDLKYARHSASGWQVETVEVGAFTETALALDANDIPYISYCDPGSRSLKVAYRDGAGWHTQVVDGAGDRGLHSSIGVDDEGALYISYYDADNRDLLLAVRHPDPTPHTYNRHFPLVTKR